MSRRSTVLVLAMTVALFAGACGNDDDADTATGAGTGTGTGAQAAEPASVTIGTKEEGEKTFAFVDVPATLEAGAVTFNLDNSTGKAPHDIQMVKLSDGHTVDELVASVSDPDAPVPGWITEANGVGLVPPGQERAATFAVTEGEWAYFCTESSGEGENEVSHAAAGMKGTVKVEGTSDAELPAADATIEAKDYSFVTDGLKAGSNTIEFQNTGAQIHHALLFPIAPGKTFDDVKAAMASEEEPQGPPPVDFEKGVGTAVYGGGQSGVVTFDLAAGKYALICFMPDKGTGGPPHVAKGMLAEVTIT